LGGRRRAPGILSPGFIRIGSPFQSRIISASSASPTTDSPLSVVNAVEGGGGGAGGAAPAEYLPTSSALGIISTPAPAEAALGAAGAEGKASTVRYTSQVGEPCTTRGCSRCDHALCSAGGTDAQKTSRSDSVGKETSSCGGEEQEAVF
jgi:hypothetical protein